MLGVAALVLAGCAEGSTRPETASASTEALATGRDGIPPTGLVAPTGTVVGQRVIQLGNDLATLQANVQRQIQALAAIKIRTQGTAAGYYETVAAISARLQVGTTPGNPRLQAAWTQAKSQLDGLTNDVSDLSQLSSDINSAASAASYLQEAVRATYGLSGAVDEDHEALKALEDEIARATVQIDRLQNEATEAVTRQNAYIVSERRNLSTLSLAIAKGELFGQALGTRPFVNANLPAPGAPPAAPPLTGGTMPMPPAGDGAVPASSRPLVVIRFDRPNVSYEQAVYQAATQALDRFPNAAFEIVAVSPGGGGPNQSPLAATEAKRNADQVYRTLAQLGLSGDRVRLSATSSAAATSPEVHIYLRS